MGLVGALYAIFTVAIAFTYAFVPVDELYHVSETGAAGGLGRALVFLNFPTSLAAIAVLAVAVDRLLGGSRRRLVVGAAGLALLLCLTTAVPGVVDQDDLDAKPLNALAAAGVALVAALTIVAGRRSGLGRLAPERRGDSVRLTLAGVLVAVGIPWILADVGVYADDVPGLGSIFMSDEVLVDDEGHASRAVHLGDHHGTDGMLLALTALALSRVVPSLRSRRLGLALGGYVALMLVYGLANAAQDGWLEQVVKRGWTGRELPHVLVPEPTWAWGLLLLSAVPCYLVLFGWPRRAGPDGEVGTAPVRPAL